MKITHIPVNSSNPVDTVNNLDRIHLDNLLRNTTGIGGDFRKPPLYEWNGLMATEMQDLLDLDEKAVTCAHLMLPDMAWRGND